MRRLTIPPSATERGAGRPTPWRTLHRLPRGRSGPTAPAPGATLAAGSHVALGVLVSTVSFDSGAWESASGERPSWAERERWDSAQAWAQRVSGLLLGGLPAASPLLLFFED